MKKALLWTTLLGLFLTPSVAAKDGKIVCFTPRQSKKLVIQNNSISVSRAIDFGSRSVASLIPARTRVVGNGFNKIIFYAGQKYIIHVEDKASFSEVEDYLTVRSQEGHEMTYPLKCEN